MARLRCAVGLHDWRTRLVDGDEFFFWKEKLCRRCGRMKVRDVG